MPKNQLTRDQIKIDIIKIKNALYDENVNYSTDIKSLAHKYLNMVLDKIEEYRY
jgi:hypothetical protein